MLDNIIGRKIKSCNVGWVTITGITEDKDRNDWVVEVKNNRGSISKYRLFDSFYSGIFEYDEELFSIIRENKNVNLSEIKVDRLVWKISTIVRSKHSVEYEGLVHYTTYDNLKKIIMSNALKSRNFLNDENARYYDSANQSVINKTGNDVKSMVRLFYYYNTPVSYNFEKANLLKGYVALVFDTELLKCEPVVYCEMGAGKREFATTDDPAKAFDYNWGKILERGPMMLHDKEAIGYRNAEVLCINGHLSLKYLKSIYFRSKVQYKLAKLAYNGHPIEALFKYDYEGIRFSYHDRL